MNIKRINEFFGCAFCVLGVLKAILIILVVIQLGINISAIFNGGDINNEYYPLFSAVVGGIQVLLLISSIVMIIVSIRKQPEVIRGYLLGLVALLIEFVTPSIIYFYVALVECGIYIKAGTKIRNENLIHKSEYKSNKKIVNNTEWFYNDENNHREDKEKKRIAKLEKEISEWQELLALGEIDEAMYNEEKNKLIEKINRYRKS